MAKKSKTQDEDLEEVRKTIKSNKKVVSEMNKKLKMLQKGEIKLEEIKPFFEG